jgi:hypothetical protein
MPLYFEFKMSFWFFWTTREGGAVHAGKGGMGHVMWQYYKYLQNWSLHFNTVDQWSHVRSSEHSEGFAEQGVSTIFDVYLYNI